VNQRRFPRVPVHLAMTYRSAAELRAATIETLSEGGVFIRTRAPLPIGTPIDLDITVQDQEHGSITLRGKVVWVRPAPDLDRGDVDLPEGMGVAFLDTPPEPLLRLLRAAKA
jgi:type IV pilus assembly protein PilZ